MLTIKDLADSIGLSTSQVRRRLRALDGLVQTTRGKKNRLLVEENGLTLLQQVKNYRQTGMTTEQAIEKIRRELDKEEDNAGEGSHDHRQTTEKLAEMRAENRMLKRENDLLREQLTEKDAYIRQLLPKPETEGSDMANKSLFAVIKEWLQQPA